MVSGLQSMPTTYPAWPSVRASLRKVMQEQFEKAPAMSVTDKGPDFSPQHVLPMKSLIGWGSGSNPHVVVSRKH